MVLSAATALEAASAQFRLRGGRLDVGQAGKVVSGGGQFEPELVAGPAQVAQLAAGADRLDPTEHLFDLLAPALTLAVAGMPGRVAVVRAASTALGLSHMGRHPQTAHIRDEVARVVGQVRAERGWPADAALQHRQGRVSFGVAAGLGQLDINDQPVAVLGQQMAQVAEPRLLLGTLAVEPRLGIGARLVRLTAAALTLEVARTVSVAALARVLVARTVALVRGPGLQQRAVDREAIGGDQAATTSLAHDLLQQDPGDIRRSGLSFGTEPSGVNPNISGACRSASPRIAALPRLSVQQPP